ncbi:hypothetical protein ACQUW5_00605 [Legionella sp. CNM-1927-20]|uniref:hypothetical protein n=1 Tax=Legionella sp. CNM-1927-20 TaxID=3422221 RepID=UPI00403ACE2F
MNFWKKNSDSEKKSELIKEIVWHLAQGMPCYRGSAAICEILYEALLNVNNLTNFSNSKTNDIPLDLKIIFTSSPIEFSRLVSIQPKPYNGSFNQLKESLTNFIQNQTTKENSSTTFFSSQAASNKTQFIEAEVIVAQKIFELLDGNLEIIFTSEEKQILESGVLAQLLDSYKDVDSFDKEHLYFFIREQESTLKHTPF